MNKDVSKVYAVVTENEIVCWETTLKGFADRFKEVEKKAPSYRTFIRRFDDADRFTQTIGDKEYHFQKVI